MTEAHSLPLIREEIQRPDAGPRPTTTLRSRRSPLAEPRRQIESLDRVSLGHLPAGGDFEIALEAKGPEPFTAGRIEIFQINLGKLCNMTCRHCHVDAGPDRWREVMNRETVDACLAALDRTDAHTVDLTGGAPELNPNFRYLVDECVARGKHVIDRCNLTVLLLQRYSDLRWCARYRTFGAATPTLNAETAPSKNRSRRSSGSTLRATDRAILPGY